MSDLQHHAQDVSIVLDGQMFRVPVEVVWSRRSLRTEKLYVHTADARVWEVTPDDSTHYGAMVVQAAANEEEFMESLRASCP